jgi:sugar transferase (PEP-CTERM/EpsH1 system associated)
MPHLARPVYHWSQTLERLVSVRILFLAFELPYPLDRGGRIKSYHYLQALAKRHHVTLVALSRSLSEQQHLEVLRADLADVHLVPVNIALVRKLRLAVMGLPRWKPFVMSLYASEEMAQLLRELMTATSFDVIYADHLHMAQHVPKNTSAFTVLDQHNIETVILRRFFENQLWGPLKAFGWWEWKRMERYEMSVCRDFDLILATTPVDAELIRPWMRAGQRLEVLPIGVDVQYFDPLPRPPATRTIVSIGTMAWQPNSEGLLWFCREILPLVRAKVPDLKLQIIGDRPPPAVRHLGSDSQIKVLGRVGDVRPYMANSAALIVPLRVGSGMRVKILNALAMGVPVVSTAVGCEGIAVTHGQDVLIADEPLGFAKAIVELVSDREVQQRLSRNGRALVMERYSWPVIYDQIDRVFAEIPSQRKEP